MGSKSPHSMGSRVLTLAGLGTLCMAALQALMPFSHSLVRAFDGPDEWSTPLLFASSFAVAGVLVLVSLYPFSGAGRIRRLPFLRLVLVVVGIVLVYRGLPLALQIAGALGHGSAAETWSWGGIVSCAGTLVIGLGYLFGLVLSWSATAKVKTALPTVV